MVTNNDIEQGITNGLVAELGAKYSAKYRANTRLGWSEPCYFVECGYHTFGIRLCDCKVLLYRQGGVGVPPDTCLVDLADPHLLEKLANFVREQPQR